MEDMKIQDIANELLIINKKTIDNLFTLNNCSDCVALYIFYYKTAKWQKTNCIKATDEYVKRCLKWGYDKIKKTKQILKENGLIEIVQKRENGKIVAWYIQINYIISNQKENCIKEEIYDDNFLEKPEVGKPRCGKQEPNAYINIIKMLKENKEVLKENNKNNNILNSFNIHNEEDILNSSNILNELFLLKENQKKIEKENEELKKRAKTKSKEFVPPTLEEVKQYCLERNNKLDYKYFYDYFTEGNWKDSNGNQVKNWKQKIITWEKNKINKQEEHKQSQGIVYEQLN